MFPKQYITFNPMQYVVMRHKKDDMDLFAEETDTETGKVKPISYEQYQKLTAQLGKRSKDAILPVQIAYFTGLRLGEVAGYQPRGTISNSPQERPLQRGCP